MTDKPEVEFTKAGLLNAPPRAKRYDVRDPKMRGLVCMVTPAGTHTYYLVRKVRGKTERIRIGRVEDVSLTVARTVAERLKNDIARGADPAKDKREALHGETLGELWDAFLERYAKAKKRSWHTDEKRWKKHLAKWSNRQLREITRVDVVRFLDDITADAGPIQANRVRALLHTMFRVAQKWGWEIGNPVAGTPRNRENRSERYLSAHELRAFIRAARAEEEPVTHDVLLLLLFTGVRSHSLLSARVDEFDLRGKLWRIPPEHAKAGRELLVPLAPAAAEIVDARVKSHPGAEHLFPSNRRDEGHITTPREGLTRVCLQAGLKDVTPHVLRHTFATTAETIGIPRAIIAEALGHTKPGGVTAVYTHVNIDLVRLAVEKTVVAMLRVADVSDKEAAKGNLLAFPTPAWAVEASS